jgi:recombination protein RecT
MNVNASATKQLSVIEQFRRDLEKMGPQFAYALPAHIPVERFMRVVMTAIQNQPKLLACTRQSIFNSCMKCAQDGLLPDGREAAIVPFGENEDGQKKSEQATYMPMVAGIRKKARNSGEIADLWAREVREGDAFDYQEGDEPHILHKPALAGGSEREITHVYSICKFKDGGLSRCVMTIAQVEEIRRKFSRAKKGGPWNDPVTYGEMVKKTVVRRHAKELPSSSDLDTVLRRDDDLYEFKDARERGKEAARRAPPANTMAALEQFAGPTQYNPGEHENPEPPPPSGGAPDLADPRPGDDVLIEAAPNAPSSAEPSTAEAIGSLINNATKHPPTNVEQFRLLARAMLDLARTGEADAIERIKVWWASPAGRAMRNKAQMTSEDTADLAAEIKAAIEGPAE